MRPTELWYISKVARKIIWVSHPCSRLLELGKWAVSKLFFVVKANGLCVQHHHPSTIHFGVFPLLLRQFYHPLNSLEMFTGFLMPFLPSSCSDIVSLKFFFPRCLGQSEWLFIVVPVSEEWSTGITSEMMGWKFFNANALNSLKV